MEVTEDFDIQSAVIGGLGSRETLWGLILNPPGSTGTGGGGHGRGLLQMMTTIRRLPELAVGKIQGQRVALSAIFSPIIGLRSNGKG